MKYIIFKITYGNPRTGCEYSDTVYTLADENTRDTWQHAVDTAANRLLPDERIIKIEIIAD